MSRGMEKRNKRTESEEVEDLLRAAEDDVFLKLSVNSHMARGSSAQFIDPDLDQRFQALKSKKITPKKSQDNQTPSADDLLTRFAALKSSLPSYSSASSSAVENEENDDDEVEKVIKWAIDAARLDPSPPSGTDDDDDDDDDDISADEDEDVIIRDDNRAVRVRCGTSFKLCGAVQILSYMERCGCGCGAG